MNDLIALLQTVVLLLGTLQGNPNITNEARESILNIATEAIQLSNETLIAQNPITAIGETNDGNTVVATVEVVTNNPSDPLTSYWPNYERLTQSYYEDLEGNQVLPGEKVFPRYEHLSFGDLNGDGRDDAMVIVKRLKADGSVIQSLAPMINDGQSLTNVDNLTLGINVTVSEHRITNNRFKLQASVDGGPVFTRYYQLLDNKLRQVEN